MGEDVSIVWDRNGRFFQVWQSTYNGDGKSHAEAIAKQIGGSFMHVVNPQLHSQFIDADVLEKVLEELYETAELKYAARSARLADLKRGLKFSRID